MKALHPNLIPTLSLGALYMSEKFDGIQAVRKGNELFSRNGTKLHAPKAYIREIPPDQIGELWTARADFDNVQSIVMSHDSQEEKWFGVKFLMFNSQARETPLALHVKWHRPVDHKEITMFYARTVRARGEGIVIRKYNDEYKVKPTYDREARVIGYQDGEGKYEGQCGALVIEFNGIRQKVGSGLTDAQRQAPPKIGSVITVAYGGITKLGLLRFPRFIAVRNPATLLKGVR
jgi:DNA ligase-1